MTTQPTDRYVAGRYPNGSWYVGDRIQHYVVYDGGADVLDEQEARDLAWAWQHGAENDDQAVQMVIQRDGGLPSWLESEEEES